MGSFSKEIVHYYHACIVAGRSLCRDTFVDKEQEFRIFRDSGPISDKVGHAEGKLKICYNFFATLQKGYWLAQSLQKETEVPTAKSEWSRAELLSREGSQLVF